MYLLNEHEIKRLAIEIEQFVFHQRKIAHILSQTRKGLDLIIVENPRILAKEFLDGTHRTCRRPTHHLPSDVERLAQAVRKNLTNMDWYFNQC